MSLELSRRDWMQAMGFAGAGLALAPAVAAAAEPVLRVAHLTDPHIQPELGASEGLAACLAHVQGQARKPDVILFGGDCVMDAFEATRDRTVTQWKLWRQVIGDCSIPMRACIGNHDIWGWNKAKSAATGDEADYGKKWSVEALQIPHRYYSFEKAGWKLIALDSIQPGEKPGTYSAYLDDEQFEWLKTELAQTPATMPTLVWSHVPIASIFPMLDQRATPTSTMSVSAGLTHTDAGKLVRLLASHSQVKLCLSGHLHKVERIEMYGLNLFCNGAVSGAWWKGAHAGFREGYALLDLYADGTFQHEYVTYGWQSRA